MKTKALRNIKYGIMGMVIALAVSQTAIGQKPCERWDVSGEWRLIQSNDTTVKMTLHQSGSAITGKATYRKSKYDMFDMSGTLEGTINGNQFSVKVYWASEKSVGVYTGEIAPSGRINGKGYDQFHPETKAEWYSTRKARCL